MSNQVSHGSRYRVCFVCSGNICRSPMAEWVTRDGVSRLGIDGLVDIDSAGIGAWHVGDSADERAMRVALAAGYDIEPPHTARQFRNGWFAERDLIVALDGGHAEALRAMAPDTATADKVRLLREFDPASAAGSDLDVADPYYGGIAGFERCLDVIEASCEGLLAMLRDAVDRR